MGSIITSLIVGIFNVIGKALAGAFLAELNLVQDFINNTHIVLGGSFNNLLGFNAIVIPGLAILVALVWLTAKGLTGGNSKTSTEDIFKRVLGALVISFTLSLIINPVEGLIGALDASLMSLVNVNSQGLQHTFAGIATISSIGGIEDSIFISIVILFIGILIAGALILILILAHAAVFLLVYFAPYLTLFRKEGFREAVEGVVAALSMPFIVTSILAVGIATMGATATTSSAALVASTTLSAVVGSHLLILPMTLTSSSTSISAVDYFTNAIGGLLILGAAVFLPKFILGMVFQAGTAMHDAFRSGHQQLAGQAMNHATPKEGGKISRLLHSKLGAKEGESTAAVGQGGPGYRNSLTDQAINTGKGTSSPTVTGVQTTSTSPTSENVTQNRANSPADPPTSSGLNSAGSINSDALAGASSPLGPPSVTADDVSTQAPLGVDASVDTESATPLAGAESSTNPALTSGSPSAKPAQGSKQDQNTKPLSTRVAHFTKDHYKGTVRAIPAALSSMPRISPESPIQTTLEARSAWRAAKRQNISQVRAERATDEKENPREWRKKDSGKPPPPPDSATTADGGQVETTATPPDTRQTPVDKGDS